MGNVLGDRLVGVSGDLGKERRVHRSQKAFALGALAPLLLVCACSGDPEPKVAAPTTSLPTPTSPSPSGPVEPVLPEAAKAHTAAGAEAFVRFFWDTANYSQQTGDVSPMNRLVSRTCGPCHSAIDYVQGVYRRGGSITGGEASVRSVTSQRLYAGSRVIYRVTFLVANTTQLIDEPGTKRDKTFDAAEVKDRFVLDPAPSGGWTLSVWEVLS